MEELVLSMISLKIASGALVYFLACHRPLDQDHILSRLVLYKSMVQSMVSSYLCLPGDSETLDDAAGDIMLLVKRDE